MFGVIYYAIFASGKVQSWAGEDDMTLEIKNSKIHFTLEEEIDDREYGTYKDKDLLVKRH